MVVQNDIKAEQLEMYEKMKKRLDTGHKSCIQQGGPEILCTRLPRE
jgi:hypothetical protein